MVSGAFHIVSQEWRYFSREKSIVHTAHMGQLPPYVTGQSVFITPVPPTGTGQNGFGFRPQPYPGVTPYKGVNITNTYNNVPPIYQVGFNFGGGTSASSSGTYNISGTFDWPATNLREVELDWWPATGGTFLFITKHFSTSNSFDLMDGLRTDLFNGTSMPSRYGTVLNEGDYFIALGGDGWFNQFYVSEGFESDFVSVSMVATINARSNLAYWVHPSPFFDNFTSFSNFFSIVMRLGQ